MGRHKEEVSAEDSIEQLKVCHGHLLVAGTLQYLSRTNVCIVLVHCHSPLQCGHEYRQSIVPIPIPPHLPVVKGS